MYSIISVLLASTFAGAALAYGILAWVNLRDLDALARDVNRVRFAVLRVLLDQEVRRTQRFALLHPFRTSQRLCEWARSGLEFYFRGLLARGVIEFDDPVDGTQRDCDLIKAMEANGLQRLWAQRLERPNGTTSSTPR